jgi:hypothetical protein
VVFLYYGLGVPPGGISTRWWHPSTFLLDWPIVGAWVDVPRLGILAAALPASLISVGVFLTTRSALTRAIALSCVFTALGFAAYGFASPMPWHFFHWRWSLVIVLSGVAMGWASASPLLAARWIERGLPTGLAIYLPVSLATAAMIRGATGTDENLPFSFSPWPAFPVFGLEGGAYGIAGILLGLAAGTLLLARASERPAIALAGILCATLLPGLWFSLRFGALEAHSFAALSLVSALLLGAAQITRSGDRCAVLQRRGLHFACGAALVAIPLISGHALATGDYASNRFFRSGIVIDALQRHIQERDSYPENLDVLVEENYLDALPQPRVGFAFVSALGLAPAHQFHYSDFGSGFNLEFVATEWIQCTYTGSYYYPEDEEEFDDDPEEEEYEDSEPWNCVKDYPSLWKLEAREESEEDDE